MPCGFWQPQRLALRSLVNNDSGAGVGPGDTGHHLRSGPRSAAPETIITDGTFGLYLGWVCVAACANATATLVDSGLNPGRDHGRDQRDPAPRDRGGDQGVTYRQAPGRPLMQ